MYTHAHEIAAELDAHTHAPTHPQVHTHTHVCAQWTYTCKVLELVTNEALKWPHHRQCTSANDENDKDADQNDEIDSVGERRLRACACVRVYLSKMCYIQS